MIDSNWKATFILGAIIISVGIIINGLLINNNSQNVLSLLEKNKNTQGTGSYAVRVKDAPVWGDKQAAVTLVEFSDFDCPFCLKAYNDILPNLKRDYIDTGKLQFIYRNAPLQIHSNAKPKAIATLCAKQQKGDSAFYAFHNQLYENANSSLSVDALLEKIVKENNLNINDFSECQHSQKVQDLVDLDLADASQLEANGTPTWFIGKTNKNGDYINAIRISGTQPYSVFRILIEELLRNEK